MIEPITTQQAEPSVEELHDFYTYKLSKDRKVLEICLDRLRIINRLRSLGFYRYDQPNGTFIYVHITNSRIKIVTETQIVDAFEDYILRLPNRSISLHDMTPSGDNLDFEFTITSRQIQEQLYKSLSTWFSTLERLRPSAPIEILEDEAKSKYFFFRNTAVRVDNNGITSVPYSDLSKNIWENSIHDHDFTYSAVKGDFELFFENICGRDESRKKAAMSLLGYLMHDYYDTSLCAVLFTDVNMDTAGKAAGRTGKGLIGKALGQMLNKDVNCTKYVAIPGKGFNHNDGDGKCYSAADMSTQLIHIEDLDNSFDLEPLYGDITDGCKMRKLHENPTIRKVKFMLSMNRTMRNLEGNSTKGRLYIFELANYYSDTFRPENEFKRWFWGREWTEKDWDEFYSFMLRSQLVYFQNGVIAAQDINYYTRSLKESLPEDFFYWFEEKIKPYVEARQNVRFRKQADLFQEYGRKYPLVDDEKNRRRFTGWCKRYLDRKSIPYKEVRSTVDYLVLYPTSND